MCLRERKNCRIHRVFYIKTGSRKWLMRILMMVHPPYKPAIKPGLKPALEPGPKPDSAPSSSPRYLTRAPNKTKRPIPTTATRSNNKTQDQARLFHLTGRKKDPNSDLSSLGESSADPEQELALHRVARPLTKRLGDPAVGLECSVIPPTRNTCFT